MYSGSRATGRPAPRAAFTLIELILVVVILGIIAAIVAPQFGAGMSGAKLAIGARTVIQAARYARTMALLHQAETELVLESRTGRVRVEVAPASGENRASSNDPDSMAAAQQLTPREPPAGAADAMSLDADADAAAVSNRPTAQVTAAAFADEIRAEYLCEGVKFAFLGYEDVESAGPAAGSAPSGEDEAIRVRYRSNGTCRPYRVRVLRDADEWMDVAFDITGTGRVVRP